MSNQSFSSSEFMGKIRSIRGMDKLIEKALLLYTVFKDSETPAWVKATIVAALIYLINPVDTVPDPIPGIGFSDDLAVLVAALATIKAYITDEHRQAAKSILRKL